jgi:hypothetical protein
MAIVLRQVPAQPGQNVSSDRRTPTRYEVRADGVKIGTVYSKSKESWDTTSNGRIRTRMRGYSRTWGAVAPASDGRSPVRLGEWYYSRKRAVDALVEHARKQGR